MMAYTFQTSLEYFSFLGGKTEGLLIWLYDGLSQHNFVIKTDQESPLCLKVGFKMITINDRGSHCVISPQQGGSIVRWTVKGQEMMRRSDEAAIDSNDPLRLSSFPLVPYSNRIDHGRFRWNNKAVQVQPNFPPEAHAIHGVGWKRAWQVRAATANMCELVLDHEADEHWPWDFSASQHFSLIDGALHMTLSATNLSDESCPLAFGHHPYFDAEGASLQFNAVSVLMNAPDALPLSAAPPTGPYDFQDRAPVAGRDVDHCYAAWDGKARIDWKDHPFALEITSDLPAVVVFIPKDGVAFCFEPVPHVNNALNRPDLFPAMPIIPAGKAFTSTSIFQPVAGG
jgi:aldose 1-epimerase